jgi:hypothetical protein
MGIADGIKNFVSGAGAFQKRYDQAVKTKATSYTTIDEKYEFPALLKLFKAADGKVVDGQSAALAYIEARDPALHKVLKDKPNPTYQHYFDALVERSNKGLPLPVRLDSTRDSFSSGNEESSARPGDRPRVSSYAELSTQKLGDEPSGRELACALAEEHTFVALLDLVWVTEGSA